MEKGKFVADIARFPDKYVEFALNFWGGSYNPLIPTPR